MLTGMLADVGVIAASTCGNTTVKPESTVVKALDPPTAIFFAKSKI